jgi:diketogulonate reductase-like aldo/keto reductase
MTPHPIAPTRVVRGVTVPAILYGTAWKAERTAALTEQAIGCGFRGIDTANQRKYYMEAGAGDGIKAAIAAGTVTREELFLQTKFTPKSGQGGQDYGRLPYDPDAGVAVQVGQSIDSSLDHLGATRLDSYVLHGPSYTEGLTDDDWQAWRAMEEAAQAGRVGLIGVSNVTAEQLALLTEGARIRPAFVQNRCFARTRWDERVRALCAAHDMVYQGFSLLTANREVQASPQVRAIARRRGRTIAQIVFRFALEIGMMPLTGTSDKVHMREDLDIFGFALGEDEHKIMLEAGQQ